MAHAKVNTSNNGGVIVSDQVTGDVVGIHFSVKDCYVGRMERERMCVRGCAMCVCAANAHPRTLELIQLVHQPTVADVVMHTSPHRLLLRTPLLL